MPSHQKFPKSNKKNLYQSQDINTMRLNAIIFLLVTFVVINLTKSQFNNCSTWIPLKNHNSTEFLGDWYGYQRLSNGFKRKEVCSLYQYRWNSTVNAAEMVITNVEENGHIFTRKGQVFQTNPSVAQWKVVLKNGFSFLSSGIALDGKSHAFFAGCRKNEGK